MVTRIALGLILTSAPGAWAQQYVISTIAGGVPAPTPIAAVNAAVGPPHFLTTDATGNVYFSGRNVVYKVDQTGILTRVAGNSREGYSGDGGPAVNALLNNPNGLTVDSGGNLYICDLNNYRIRKVSPTGTITTVVGNGKPGVSGDGGLATSAQIGFPQSVAVDGNGNLFYADNRLIRQVSATTGIITTIAGNGSSGYAGDGRPAINAVFSFNGIADAVLAVDSAGNLYIADTNNYRVRKIATNGIITTVAGNGTSGYSGDGGQATDAQLYAPSGLAVDSQGNLFINDFGLPYPSFSGGRIRKVTPSGIITTVAGNGNAGYSGDGGPALNAALYTPADVAVDGAGNLFIADAGNYRIRKVSTSGVITTAAGNGLDNFSGDGGAAASAQLFQPAAVALDSSHNLYIADTYNQRIRKVSSGGVITTIAGNGIAGYAGDGGPATSAELTDPSGVAVDAAGDIFISESYNARVRKVLASGIITTFAGNGSPGYSGDGGLSTSAQLNQPAGLAVDASGNLYIADSINQRIRRVSPSGTITTVAGNGTTGYSGDGGPAVSAGLSFPLDLAFDSAGDMYISDTNNARIRKVSLNGVISTVAGGGPYGQLGDEGPATSATLNYPSGLGFDAAGNLYIMDSGEALVRKVDHNGIITTIAGNTTDPSDYIGDGGPATQAGFRCGAGVVECLIAVDAASGNIYVADTFHNAIRLLQPVNPTPTLSVIANAASNMIGPVAPGEIVTLYGSGLGPTQLTTSTLNSSGLLETQVAGTQVFFNGTAAPIIYAWSPAVSAIVPYEVSGTSAQVTVTNQGQTSPAFSVPVTSSSPGIFVWELLSSGKGQALVVNQDGSINSPDTPAHIGSIITLYATGEGQTSPGGVDGKIASVPAPKPLLPVTVNIGGQTVQPQYAGGAPGEVAGVMQINVQIPSGIQTGNSVPITFQVGGTSSQPGVTLAVAGN